MGPWLQRLVTYLAAAAVATVGALLPAAGPILYPIAGALLGWATPHPADKRGDT